MNSGWKFLVVAASGTVIGFLLVFFGEPKPKTAMLDFSHVKHQKLSCEVCHQGVRSQANGTIPTAGLCARCHNTSPDNTAVGLEIWRTAKKDDSRLWPVSYRLPKHVYFSHRRHVAIANLECVVCHGNMTVQNVPVVSPLKTLNMNSCIDCHRRKQVVDDCAQCHR
jgi:Cytochrome c7 and related cytochrome c/Class III cytochrome C family